MSDKSQKLDTRTAMSAIMCDTSCWGLSTPFNSNITAITDENKYCVIKDRKWKSLMFETKMEKIAEISSKEQCLQTYGEFVRNNLPLSSDSAARKSLRYSFLDFGHPGYKYRYAMEKAVEKLEKQPLVPSFYHLIHWLKKHVQTSEKGDGNSANNFTIVFRTFGTDLLAIIEYFNDFCHENGYSELMITDSKCKGVIVRQYNKETEEFVPYLITGTLDMDILKIESGCDLQWLKNHNRLQFFEHKINGNMNIYKGYEEIYAYFIENKGRSMAIVDDYPTWHLNEEKSQFGKLLIADKNDECNIHQMFFDDCGSYIVDYREYKNYTGFGSKQPTFVKYDEVKDRSIVHVNSYEAIVNDQYFIQQINQSNLICKQ